MLLSFYCFLCCECFNLYLLICPCPSFPPNSYHSLLVFLFLTNIFSQSLFQCFHICGLLSFSLNCRFFSSVCLCISSDAYISLFSNSFIPPPSISFVLQTNSLYSFSLSLFSALTTLSTLRGEASVMELQRRHVCLLPSFLLSVHPPLFSSLFSFLFVRFVIQETGSLHLHIERCV